MNKKIMILSSFAILSLFLSGCSIQVQNGKGVGGGADGGVFRSTNKGNLWTQQTSIPSASGKPQSFGFVDSYVLYADPTDSQTLYLGTVGQGMFYSNDGAESWQRSAGTPAVTIRSIAVDPAFRCTVYAAAENKLMKSIDCTRSFTQAYFDDDPKVTINSVAIDPKNTNVVYIGTSRGEVIKSLDRGNSWQTLNRFNGAVKQVVINPLNSSQVFAINDRNGLWTSSDAGAKWTSFEDSLREFNGAAGVKDFVISDSSAGSMFLATAAGLLKTTDYGKTWKKISLITPADDKSMNAIAVNPQNNKEIYYVTNTTVVHSLDGGQNWTTKALPSSRAGWGIMVNPDKPSTVYLIVRGIKK